MESVSIRQNKIFKLLVLPYSVECVLAGGSKQCRELLLVIEKRCFL